MYLCSVGDPSSKLHPGSSKQTSELRDSVQDGGFQLPVQARIEERGNDK